MFGLGRNWIWIRFDLVIVKATRRLKKTRIGFDKIKNTNITLKISARSPNHIFPVRQFKNC